MNAMGTLIKQAVKLISGSRKDRNSHPDGRFDKAGRWYPSNAENADGFTSRIRSPSHDWPYSFLIAARTRKHLAAVADIAPGWIMERGRVEVGQPFCECYDAWVALKAKAAWHAERQREYRARIRDRIRAIDAEIIAAAFMDAA